MPVFYPIPYAPPRRPPRRAAPLDEAGGAAPQTLAPAVRTLALATAAVSLSPASGATWSVGSPRVLTFNRSAPSFTPTTAAPAAPAVRVLSLGRVALSLTPALVVAAPAGRVLALTRTAPALSPASAVTGAPAVRVLALARATVNLTPAPVALAPGARVLALSRVAVALTPASGVAATPGTRVLSLARVTPNLSGGTPGPQTATPTSRVLTLARAAPVLSPASAVPVAPAVRVYALAASAGVAIVGTGVAPALAPAPRVLTLARTAPALTLIPHDVPARFVDTPGATRRFRRPSPGELYALDVARSDVVVTHATAAPVTIADAMFTDATDATVDPAYTVDVREVAPFASRGGAFESLSPGVATVTPAGSVARVADGVAQIRYVAKRLIRPVFLDVTRTGGLTSRTFDGYAVGSMAAAVANAVDARLIGKTAADNPTFSVVNHATATYARNPGRWSLGLDMTCRAVWNNWTGDVRMAGVLITRRHVVCSAHFSPVGTRADVKFRFVGSDGVVVERQVVPAFGGAWLGNPLGAEGYGSDVSIMTLDADVPNTVTPARLLDPATIAAKLPSIRRWAYDAGGNIVGDSAPGGGLAVPVVLTDQDLHAHVAEWNAHVTTDYATAPVVRPSMSDYNVPVGAARRAFYEGWVNEDSSSPAFLFDGGAYAILHSTASFAGAGPNYSAPTMQQRIVNYLAADGAAPGYHVQYADTSAFTTF